MPKLKEVAMKLITSKSLVTKSLVTKSLVRTGIIAASLVLAGNAFAANDSHVAANALRTAHPAPTYVTRNYQQAVPAPVAQIFQGLFGLPIPVAVTAGAASDTGGYDPTFDSPTYDSSADVDNSQSQAAIDASDQAMQQEDQSLQDMDASNAAAEEQNDEANAATQQYLINNGM
jgi:hypothetical protein